MRYEREWRQLRRYRSSVAKAELLNTFQWGAEKASSPHTSTCHACSLYNNNIGPEGAEHIANSLLTNTALQDLK